MNDDDYLTDEEQRAMQHAIEQVIDEVHENVFGKPKDRFSTVWTLFSIAQFELYCLRKEGDFNTEFVDHAFVCLERIRTRARRQAEIPMGEVN